MVVYHCEKCGKSFEKKSSYQTHLGRKYPCVPQIDKFQQLTDEVKILNKKIEDLTKLVELLCVERKTD